jgi:hypothetical protein
MAWPLFNPMAEVGDDKRMMRLIPDFWIEKDHLN